MKVFSGSANVLLAHKIAEKLGVDLSPIEQHVFPDGERRIKIDVSVVGEDTVVIQPTNTPVDQNYIELFLLVDALKRSGAQSVTAVIPYLGYQRQDHIFRDGEAVSLQVMINLLESLKVDKVVAVDLHSIKIPEMFHVPVVHLSALPLFAEMIKGNGWTKEDTYLVSPDMGGIRRIAQISELLSGMEYLAAVKDRDLVSGNIVTGSIEGDKSIVKKRAIMVDDMASSGKTLVEAAKLLKNLGTEEIVACVTHAIFSEDAPELLEHSLLQKVYVTDTVLIPHKKLFPKLEILSVGSLIAEAL